MIAPVVASFSDRRKEGRKGARLGNRLTNAAAQQVLGGARGPVGL